MFNPPAPPPSQTAPTPAASPLAPAAGDAELDELHSQADRAIPSTQSAEQLGGSSGRKRKFTLQANPSLASMAKRARGLGTDSMGFNLQANPQPGRQTNVDSLPDFGCRCWKYWLTGSSISQIASSARHCPVSAETHCKPCPALGVAARRSCCGVGLPAHNSKGARPKQKLKAALCHVKLT